MPKKKKEIRAMEIYNNLVGESIVAKTEKKIRKGKKEFDGQNLTFNELKIGWIAKLLLIIGSIILIILILYKGFSIGKTTMSYVWWGFLMWGGVVVFAKIVTAIQNEP